MSTIRVRVIDSWSQCSTVARFAVVKLAVIATHKFITCFADVSELAFFTAPMHYIEDIVVLI